MRKSRARVLMVSQIIFFLLSTNSCAGSLDQRPEPFDIAGYSRQQAAMHLAEMGLYKGPVDQLDDDVFREALRKFQDLKHLNPSGELNDVTWQDLKKVRIRSSRISRYAAFKKEKPSIRFVQERLKLAGFNPGPVDGKWGEKTRAALMKFQVSANLPARGIVDQPTMDALEGFRWVPTPIANWDEIPPKIQYVTPQLPGIELVEGAKVYALEKFECNQVSGDWLQWYSGKIKARDGEEFSVTIQHRLALRYHPESQGVMAGDWWCPDQRRFCYAEVKFSDWGGTYEVNQVVSFSPDVLFPGELGVVNVSKRVFGDVCSR